MATNNDQRKTPRMSDAAVRAKTGKDWKEWFSILDKAGAKKMSHPETARYLSANHGVGPWWQQMVTVTYEQARGLREKYQTPGGYQISVSRTVNAPLAKLYKSFANEKARNAWLAVEDLVVRKATANKSMRVTWNDGKTSLEIGFYARGDNKAQVVVQHSKLPSAKASGKMKAFWTRALDRLRASLET